MALQPWLGAAFVAHWGRPEPWRVLSRLQRERLLCLAASSHHPPSLDAALAHCGTELAAEVLASAAAAGDVQACRRLYATEGCSLDYSLVATAAGISGSLPVCEWLAEAMPGNKQAELRCVLLPAAAFAGHERVVEWALERLGNTFFWSGTWVGAAARAGRLELMQRLAVRYPFDLLEAQRGKPSLLAQVAFGCPLAVLQQYYEPWGTVLLQLVEHKQDLLLAAAASPTPDWAEKCDWLWARWGTAAAAFGTNTRRLYGWAVAGVMQHTDIPQRLQLLASRGLGSFLERHAPCVAGQIGSTAAVGFCLDQLPALLRQQAAAPVVAAGGGRPVAAAAAGQLPGEAPVAQQLQQQTNAFKETIAIAAAQHGHVPVLRLLRGRGFVFHAHHLEDAIQHSESLGAPDTRGLASLRYLLLEDPAGLAPGLAPGGGAEADWSSLFREAAIAGADLPLLRHLHEQRGASINLVAVARGGSEEALSWAVAALEAAGQAPKPLSCINLEVVLSSGNWAAADWLVRHVLAPPKQEILEQMLLRPRTFSGFMSSLSIPNLQWVPTLQWLVGVRGGQDGAHGQVQWTAELHAALVRRQNKGIHSLGKETLGRLRWLAELVEAVGVELGGAAGARQGRGQRRRACRGG
ncbi:hypothetical protein HXX76_010467 [Chlamydomonas incerta]|uniref:Uncharacterized protein n=1 Tax=Chlamydomonas incerta TaxID=51695 RepID=A0A835SJS8_CHLIN|nr:hypothetical protein HXX76_010467 [Chlamydomonas incerta]|eukprot:KAG2428319.1 hypothetical protein HXX76_010467 [Chlamydomonas incerta]